MEILCFVYYMPTWRSWNFLLQIEKSMDFEHEDWLEFSKENYNLQDKAQLNLYK